ncbi:MULTISPECIES: MerR family transcriptional regulator [Pseudomonas]|jgi:DNA-binding transcriptional MerR regulator|uniref:DNA-binding transcriptional regulator, MerR family n=1 Tax=Pseudomonas grimontii TaxID=129847 RepID=A0A1H1BY66_9PSED|nr:MerR family transcriptional regulator [Pseudomonas grimontii]TWR56848.1 MerR family transcriptional regulator [Pseudomonas grimontii]SDQ56862.1 DNA-binding transcriptional regulator, MerR family [Pseudomonas grimontii]
MPVITAPLDSVPHLDSTDSDELFPIREVSRLTGVNPVTLRAWERRYGLIQPTRTESGHRLYSKADIETVNRILDWIERGVAVSKVGKILAHDAQQAEAIRDERDTVEEGEWSQWRARLLQVVNAFDDRQLESLYGQIFATYPLNVAFQDILMPLWNELLRHQGRFGQASEWLFFDAFLRIHTFQRLQAATLSPAPRVLLAAMPGECRKLELLVAALLISRDDLAVKVLGMGQPFDELTLVCEKTRPQALIIFSNHAHNLDLAGRLNRLALTLDCPLFLAGAASDLAQDALAGSSIGCLGSEGRQMQRRLQQFLSGNLDT